MILFILGLLAFGFCYSMDHKITVKKNFRTQSCILYTAADMARTNTREGRTFCVKSFCFMRYSSPFMKSYLQPSQSFCFNKKLNYEFKTYRKNVTRCIFASQMKQEPVSLGLCFLIASSQYVVTLSVEMSTGSQGITS